MDIGQHLRDARERRGMTLRQLADATKLSTTTLRHIEQNRFDLLPGGIYTKGYLLACAAEVGLDAEGVVHEYLAQFPAHASDPQMIVAEPVVVVPWIGASRLAVAVLAILFAVLLVRSFHSVTESPISRPSDPVTAPPSSAAPGARIAADVIPATGHGIRLDIQPAGTCWVSAAADGEVVLYRLLREGERVTVIAHDEIVLRVGDPGTFSYMLNGAVGRPLGKDRKPVTVQITEGNYERFLVDHAPPSPEAAAANVT